ncbi:hypothetical protein ACFQL9_13365 [Halobaculum lipolyticum]|uniref:Transcription factor zinc-finger domain-containing protein n=1 Tax=Halobaculum lipolyticum TaxID=3032001 RepID=A0ABD5WBK7_9EURY
MSHDANTCPNCGEPVLFVSTAGPGDHRAGPCGCQIGYWRLMDLDDVVDSRPSTVPAR